MSLFKEIKRIFKNFHFAKNFPFVLKREISLFNTKAWVTSHVGKDVVLNPAFERYMASLGICIDAAPPYSPQAYPEFLLNQKNYPKMHLYAA